MINFGFKVNGMYFSIGVNNYTSFESDEEVHLIIDTDIDIATDLIETLSCWCENLSYNVYVMGQTAIFNFNITQAEEQGYSITEK